MPNYILSVVIKTFFYSAILSKYQIKFCQRGKRARRGFLGPYFSTLITWERALFGLAVCNAAKTGKVCRVPCLLFFTGGGYFFGGGGGLGVGVVPT
jgi:hypothetical protein